MTNAKDLAARLEGWLKSERILFGSNERSRDVALAKDLIEQQAAEIADLVAEVEVQRGTIEGYRSTYQGMRAHRVLRQAVDAMMAPLGYHGTISARDDRVQEVMDALAQIDQEERE